MNEILNCFNLPENALMKNRIAIKTIVEQMDISKSDEKLLRSQISALYLVGILDTETTLLKSIPIDGFLYEEIQIFFVELKTVSKNISLHNKLHVLFPNPTIFISKYQNIYTLSTSEKRINQLDSSLAVVDNVYMTNKVDLYNEKYKFFLNALDFNRYNYTNLYHVYETYQNAIYSEKLIELIGYYPKKLLVAEFIKDMLNMIADSETEISRLKELNRETISMSDKMAIYNEIKSENENISKIIERIKEEINNG